MKKILLSFLLLNSIALAQSFDGVGPSLAGAYSTSSRGINALAWNPANLALPRGNTIEVNLMSFGTELFNNSFSVNSYNRYFTDEGHGGNWNQSEKQEILDLISDDGLRMDYDVGVNILGIAFNNFAMGAQLVSQGYTALGSDKELYRTLLYGTEIDRDYTYDQDSQVEGEAYAALKFSFGWAYPFSVKRYVPQLKDVAAGISVNYFVGIGVVQIEEADVFLQRISGEEESVEYSVAVRNRFAEPDNGMLSGKGMGIDLGLTGGYGKHIDLSFTISGLGASINWKNGTQEMIAMYSDSSSIADIGENKDTAVETDTTWDVASFSTPLPTSMSIGGAYRLTREWKVMAEYRQGLDNDFGNSMVPRISAATEYRIINLFPVRGGMSVGGREGFQLGLGFGVDVPFFQFDYSFAMKGALWPTFSKGIYNAIGIKLVL